jgi:hypothetical protein
LRARFGPTTSRSHVILETSGSLDTVMTVFVDATEARRGIPLAEDDDSGAGFNSLLEVPLGFDTPYLVRIRPFGRSGGATRLRSSYSYNPVERCDWPAGCPLSVAAEGHASGGEMLRSLRAVRGEVLRRSPVGEELIDLYWRLSADLIPDLLIDSAFREDAYGAVRELLPLAEGALEVARSEGSGGILTSSQVQRLETLVELLQTRLSSELASELWSRWSSFDLSSQVGRPLADVLPALGLLPQERHRRGVAVVTKLRMEPVPSSGPGALQLSTGSSRIDTLLLSSGARSVRRVHRELSRSQAEGLGRTLAIDLPHAAAARELLATLQSDPLVEWAELSIELYAYGPPGRDPYRGDLWGLDAISAPQAWTSARGSCSAPIAIVDTGLRPKIADLAGRVLTGRGYDFVDGDSDPFDDHGHGTHVAGIAAAAVDNSASVAGVAPDACVFAVRVLDSGGSGTSEGVAAGIVHAVDSGAKVINLSLGCDCDPVRVIDDALAYAGRRDVVVVAASGNDSLDRLGYPANSPWAISVGAVDRTLTRASFSNYGAGLDVVGPGVDVPSLFTDGESCLGSGTSMATPHVAGVAALIRARDPSLNRDEVRNVLRNQARDLGAPGYDREYGAGLVHARRSVAAAQPACTAQTCLTLHRGRFEIRVDWKDFDGNTGSGRVVPVESMTSGLMWFFRSNNWEMLIKVLNGCPVNDHYWVFAAATTNVEYTLHVTDKNTGATTSYHNPLGRRSPAVTDTRAFASCPGATTAAPNEALATTGLPTGALAEALSQDAWLQDPDAEVLAADMGWTALEPVPDEVFPKAGPCPAGQMCLNRNRFRVEVDWTDARGNQGVGRSAAAGSDDSGLLWFFDRSNWEMLVKVLNGCGVNGHYWVFAAATTNVEYRLRIIDRDTGQRIGYVNTQGRRSPALVNTRAFPCGT